MQVSNDAVLDIAILCELVVETMLCAFLFETQFNLWVSDVIRLCVLCTGGKNDTLLSSARGCFTGLQIQTTEQGCRSRERSTWKVPWLIAFAFSFDLQT